MFISEVMTTAPQDERGALETKTYQELERLNDPEGKVKVVIDKAVADAEWFACNPGANTTHIKFKTKQLLNNFLPAEGHKAEIIML